MKPIYVFFLFFSFSISMRAQSTRDAADLVATIQEANALCTSKNPSCVTTSLRPKPNPQRVVENMAAAGGSMDATGTTPSAPLLTKTTITDMHGRDLEVSVIQESEINNLTSLYPNKLRIYDPALCASRAHVIGNTLAANGVETVKLILQPEWGLFFSSFIIPDEKARSNRKSTPQWEFHVANLIYVQKTDGSLEEYIIDPFMESKPVPRSHWESRLRSNPKSSIASMDIVSRFVMDTGDLKNKDMQYDERRLNRSYQIMNMGQ